LTSGVPVNLPDSRAKALDQDQKPIEVSIDATGALFIDKDPVSEQELSDRFDAIAAQSGTANPPQIFLRADRNLGYQRVMQVLGELNRAGLNRVALVTASKNER
jgi:biopolymer transport protein TolR